MDSCKSQNIWFAIEPCLSGHLYISRYKEVSAKFCSQNISVCVVFYMMSLMYII